MTLGQLPDATKKFLGQLREEEVATLERFSRLSKDEQDKIFEAMKFFAAAMRVGKAMRWLIIVFVGAVFGTMALADQIAKILAFIQQGLGQ